MRDYIVKSNIEISFKSTIYASSDSVFDAEAKVGKIIREVLCNDRVINSFVDSGENIEINIKSKAFQYFKNNN